MRISDWSSDVCSSDLGQPWGVRAMVPTGFDWSAVKTRLDAPTCPRVHDRHSQWKTAAEWRALGVQPQSYLAPDVLATLFQSDGPGTPAWLLTSNYRAILAYNCSNSYAMSVGLLADGISRYYCPIGRGKQGATPARSANTRY